MSTFKCEAISCTVLPKTCTDFSGNWVAAMSTRADPYYLTASVTCYLTVLKNVEDDDLEEYFLHELMQADLIEKVV